MKDPWLLPNPRFELDFRQSQDPTQPLQIDLYAEYTGTAWSILLREPEKVTDPLRMDFAGIAEKTVHDLVGVLRQEGLTNEEIAAALDLSIAGFRPIGKLKASDAEADDPHLDEA